MYLFRPGPLVYTKPDGSTALRWVLRREQAAGLSDNKLPFTAVVKWAQAQLNTPVMLGTPRISLPGPTYDFPVLAIGDGRGNWTAPYECESHCKAVIKLNDAVHRELSTCFCANLRLLASAAVAQSV